MAFDLASEHLGSLDLWLVDESSDEIIAKSSSVSAKQASREPSILTQPSVVTLSWPSGRMPDFVRGYAVDRWPSCRSWRTPRLETWKLMVERWGSSSPTIRSAHVDSDSPNLMQRTVDTPTLEVTSFASRRVRVCVRLDPLSRFFYLESDGGIICMVCAHAHRPARDAYRPHDTGEVSV